MTEPSSEDTGRSESGWERIDEDPSAETGDTRIRIDSGDNDTYALRREQYGLVEFESVTHAEDGEAFERYDWSTDKKFVLRGESEAKQFASMLADEDAFDPAVLFFRQCNSDGLDAETDRSGGESA